MRHLTVPARDKPLTPEYYGAFEEHWNWKVARVLEFVWNSGKITDAHYEDICRLFEGSLSVVPKSETFMEEFTRSYGSIKDEHQVMIELTLHDTKELVVLSLGKPAPYTVREERLYTAGPLNQAELRLILQRANWATAALVDHFWHTKNETLTEVVRVLLERDYRVAVGDEDAGLVEICQSYDLTVERRTDQACLLRSSETGEEFTLEREAILRKCGEDDQAALLDEVPQVTVADEAVEYQDEPDLRVDDDTPVVADSGAAASAELGDAQSFLAGAREQGLDAIPASDAPPLGDSSDGYGALAPFGGVTGARPPSFMDTPVAPVRLPAPGSLGNGVAHAKTKSDSDSDSGDVKRPMRRETITQSLARQLIHEEELDDDSSPLGDKKASATVRVPVLEARRNLAGDENHLLPSGAYRTLEDDVSRILIKMLGDDAASRVIPLFGRIPPATFIEQIEPLLQPEAKKPTAAGVRLIVEDVLRTSGHEDAVVAYRAINRRRPLVEWVALLLTLVVGIVLGSLLFSISSPTATPKPEVAPVVSPAPPPAPKPTPERGPIAPTNIGNGPLSLSSRLKSLRVPVSSDAEYRLCLPVVRNGFQAVNIPADIDLDVVIDHDAPDSPQHYMEVTSFECRANGDRVRVTLSVISNDRRLDLRSHFHVMFMEAD